MSGVQREQNPDVNSYQPDVDPGTDTDVTDQSEDKDRGIEQPPTDDVIPVPPGVEPSAPVEEPPGTGGPPVGDVDDSPKRIT